MENNHQFTGQYSRRHAIKAALSAMSMSIYRPDLARADENIVIKNEFTPSNPNYASEWMHRWMNDKKKPVGALHISRFADPIYFLLKPITWMPNSDQEGKYNSITVPVGFVTDFASIPQIFWSALRPDGLYTYAAIVHDYLYWEQNLDKSDADMIFKLCMQDFNIDTATIAALYRTVQLFGGSAWAENNRLKSSGERRILTRFPSDPTTKWNEWKKDTLVFE